MIQSIVEVDHRSCALSPTSTIDWITLFPLYNYVKLTSYPFYAEKARPQASIRRRTGIGMWMWIDISPPAVVRYGWADSTVKYSEKQHHWLELAQ